MRKIDFKSVFIPTISLFVICLMVTVALSVTNAVTKDKIAENELKSQQESMKTVCPDADSFEEIEPDVLYAAKDSAGNTVGYAVSTTANGYGGQIKVMTGIKDSTIQHIDVYYNDDETPGLGKNTSDESFTKGFEGLDIDTKIVVHKDFDPQCQSVDAVTSATISSRAVTSAVNTALDIYNKSVVGGEQ